MALPKNSPYKIFMDSVLLNMFESGQIKRIYEKWDNKKKSSCEPLLTSGNPLSLEKLISIFLIICVGLPIGLIVLVWELCNTKQKISRLENVDFLRFEMIVSEINKSLCKKTRPNVGLLTLLQDASEKIKKE